VLNAVQRFHQPHLFHILGLVFGLQAADEGGGFCHIISGPAWAVSVKIKGSGF
jgi:hypothetical protein